MIRKISLLSLDEDKYQVCLAHSVQYKFYAELEFLKNHPCHWEFLVWGDYLAVMPIPIFRKWGINVVVHPKLCQQLGIFSSTDDVVRNSKFLEFLQQKYRVWYYAFNETNQFSENLAKRKNYILYPNSYEKVFKNYSPKRRRKLRLNPQYEGRTQCCKLTNRQMLWRFISQHQLGYKGSDVLDLFDLLWRLYLKDELFFYAFYLDNQLINLLCLYKKNNTVALFGMVNHPDFLKVNASSVLLDWAIKEHIDSCIFDFEGSNIPAIESFFSGFRPVLKHYSYIQNSKFKIILPKILFYQKYLLISLSFECLWN